jgi:hypothetical protein
MNDHHHTNSLHLTKHSWNGHHYPEQSKQHMQHDVKKAIDSHDLPIRCNSVGTTDGHEESTLKHHLPY